MHRTEKKQFDATRSLRRKEKLGWRGEGRSIDGGRDVWIRKKKPQRKEEYKGTVNFRDESTVLIATKIRESPPFPAGAFLGNIVPRLCHRGPQ